MFIVFDRYNLARISQWREDQATNLWLGYKLLENYPVVGLLSSAKIFNPNGMALISWPLSFLPNLIWVSFILGMLQVFSIYMIGKSIFQSERMLLTLFLGITLSSVTMRASGNELWNQWMITPLFLFSLASILRGKKRIAIIFLFSFPALYLGGASYFVATLLFVAFQLIINNELNFVNIKKIFIYFVVATFLYVTLTWYPFFSNVDIHDFSKVSTLATGQKVLNSLTQILQYPKMLYSFATIYKTIYTYDLEIISKFTKKLFNIHRMILMIQTSVFFISIVVVFLTKRKIKEIIGDQKNKRILSLALVPIFVIAITALMGGPSYASESIRLDQVVALVPLYYLTIFFVPMILWDEKSKFQKYFRNISSSLAIVFILINIFLGYIIVNEQINYKGNHISNADIPLVDKSEAISFVANDWKLKSKNKVISVDYDLAGRWEGVDKFGEKLNKFFKAPMTIGRSFDYELDRVYGLKNSQEGTQFRSIGNGKYVISYLHENKSYSSNERVFGRLKVSIR